MERTLVKKKTTFFEALRIYGMKATVSNGQIYYFIPFWFKSAGNFDLEMIPFEKLPQEIKDELQRQKNENNSKQDHSVAETAATYHNDTAY